MDRSGVALLALAIGSGSLFFSHVNDAGFWLVKEYFGLSVGDTLKTWSVMETIISVAGLAGVLGLRVFVSYAQAGPATASRRRTRILTA